MVHPTVPPTADATLDPLGPLHVPDYRLDEEGPVSVLIDPERVRWIGVNRIGRRLIDEIRARAGQPGRPLVEQWEGDGTVPVRRFLKDLHRRGFLANAPFAPHVHPNRREVLDAAKLHELWVVTNDNCNLRCRHCYTIERVKQGRTGIPGAALLGILGEAHELGTEVFYFTGGEPTMRHDFLDLARFVLERAKLILFTNGLTIDDALAGQLAQWRERLVVQVSIEGPDEAINTPVRGKGSYTKAMAGVRTLLRHGIRVGVSTTPNGVSKDAIDDITAQLAALEEGGQRVDYHHLIMLLDRGGARDHADIGALGEDDLHGILARSKAALGRARAIDRAVKLKLTNQKIFAALATNGPAKDFCGAGYTILGVSADGKLLPCAACMDDERYFLGDLLNADHSYAPGRLRELWQTSDAVERIRRFSLARKDGAPVRDLRYFHGGGCWKNMADPELDFFDSHPFAHFYEREMLAAIREAATRGVELSERAPELVSFMHAARISCAGERKTVSRGGGSVDQGHCICFA